MSARAAKGRTKDVAVQTADAVLRMGVVEGPPLPVVRVVARSRAAAAASSSERVAERVRACAASIDSAAAAAAKSSLHMGAGMGAFGRRPPVML